MPSATLRVSIPWGTWMQAVSAAHPDAAFRVVAVSSRDTGGVVLVVLLTDSPVPLLADIDRRDDVARVDLLWTREDRSMIQVETAEASLLAPVEAAGVPLRTPFEVRKGTATWEVTTSRERLSALGTRLEDAGVAFDIESVRADPAGPGDSLLTDRQHEVLEHAAERGYYDTPRRVTLTDLAAELDVSKGTASDILNRAEGAVVSWFLDRSETTGEGTE